MVMMDESFDSTTFDTLPNELVVSVFSQLSSRDLLSVIRANRRFRRIASVHARNLNLVPVHCHASVLDVDEPRGSEPFISYIFTAFDKATNEYSRSVRDCFIGNDLHYKAILVQSQRFGGLSFTAMRRNGKELELGSQEKYDEVTALGIFSRMCVVAVRFDVQKQGKRMMHRIQDDIFVNVLNFCEKFCGQVRIKSLHLTSRNPRFHWEWSPASVHRFKNLNSLESLTTEGFAGLGMFNDATLIPIVNLSYLHLRITHGHREEFANRTTWLPIDGSLLLRLASLAPHQLEVDLYSIGFCVITAISAKDMCTFMRAWRSLVQPWKIRSINFNSTTTISEFRTVAHQMGLFLKDALIDVPYCKFRTHHPSDPNHVLDLICFASTGTMNQWSFKSGYPEFRGCRQRSMRQKIAPVPH
ncbi:unnamed protein product, partial [Mesorhabditis belari]|uniref:F-box domain-containing protein n=1 Tax=Mesorhabditis belari TaxID=2138241 RepID=A0AAF3EAC9_9BILA